MSQAIKKGEKSALSNNEITCVYVAHDACPLSYAIAMDDLDVPLSHHPRCSVQCFIFPSTAD